MRQDVIAHSTTSSADKPQWLQDRLKWFRDQQFGIILHWGLYAFWDCCESWPLVPEDTWARGDMKCWNERNHDLDLFQKDYWNLIEQFIPTKFDPDPKADVTKHLFDALRRAGLGVSVYFSKADWHCPYYWSPEPKPFHRGANTLDRPEIFEKFVQYTHKQIRELLTNYGPIDILWLDAGWVKDKEDIRMAEIVEIGRKLQPGLLVANRTVGDFEDLVTPEREIPDDALPETWEACLPLGPDWKYTEGQPLKSAETVYEELKLTNSKGGNFLLGIGPKYDGTIPDRDSAILKELGKLVRQG